MKRARGDQHTVDVCADTHPVSYQSCVFSRDCRLTGLVVVFEATSSGI